MIQLGELLNSVDLSPRPCPACRKREQYQVFENGVLWRCGLVSLLPPIGQERGPRPGARGPHKQGTTKARRR